MKSKFKKNLALVLAAIFAISLLPLSALASSDVDYWECVNPDGHAIKSEPVTDEEGNVIGDAEVTGYVCKDDQGGYPECWHSTATTAAAYSFDVNYIVDGAVVSSQHYEAAGVGLSVPEAYAALTWYHSAAGEGLVDLAAYNHPAEGGTLSLFGIAPQPAEPAVPVEPVDPETPAVDPNAPVEPTEPVEAPPADPSEPIVQTTMLVTADENISVAVSGVTGFDEPAPTIAAGFIADNIADFCSTYAIEGYEFLYALVGKYQANYIGTYDDGTNGSRVYYAPDNSGSATLLGSEPITLYFKQTVESWSVTYNVNMIGDVVPGTVTGPATIKKGDGTLSFDITPKNGNYSVADVTVDGATKTKVNSNLYNLSNPTKDVTVTVTFKTGNNYIINWNNGNIRQGNFVGTVLKDINPDENYGINNYIYDAKPDSTTTLYLLSDKRRNDSDGVATNWNLDSLLANKKALNLPISYTEKNVPATTKLDNGTIVTVTLVEFFTAGDEIRYLYAVTLSGLAEDVNFSEGNFKSEERKEIVVKALPDGMKLTGYDEHSKKNVSAPINKVLKQRGTSLGNKFSYAAFTVPANHILEVYYRDDTMTRHDLTVDSNRSFTIPNGMGTNLKLYIEVNPIVYGTSFDDGQGGITTTEKIYGVGETFWTPTVPPAPPEDQYFKGWKLAGTPNNAKPYGVGELINIADIRNYATDYYFNFTAVYADLDSIDIGEWGNYEVHYWFQKADGGYEENAAIQKTERRQGIVGETSVVLAPPATIVDSATNVTYKFNTGSSNTSVQLDGDKTHDIINLYYDLDTFNIVWYNDDGATVLDSATARRGEAVPAYKGTPTVELQPVNKEAGYVYEFTGWTSDPDPVPGTVSSDIRYTATYSKKRPLTSLGITLADYNGTYDGNYYGVTVEGLTEDLTAEIEVQFSLDGATDWQPSITRKDAGNTKVYGRIVPKTGFESKYVGPSAPIGDAMINISKREVEATFHGIDVHFKTAGTYDDVAFPDGWGKGWETGKAPLGSDESLFIIKGTRVPGETAGTYTIRWDEASGSYPDHNYTLKVNDGKLLIKKAGDEGATPVTITIGTRGEEKVYDGKAVVRGGAADAYVVGNLPTGFEITGLTAASISQTNVTPTPIEVGLGGAFEITFNGELLDEEDVILNYELGEINITQRPVTLVPDKVDWTHGEARPELTASPANPIGKDDGWLEAEKPDVTGLLTCPATETNEPNSYTISFIEGAKAILEGAGKYPNYNFTLGTASYTISSDKTVFFTIDPVADVFKTYNGTAQSVPAVTTTQTKGDYTLTLIIGGTAERTNVADGPTPIPVTYSIAYQGDPLQNVPDGMVIDNGPHGSFSILPLEVEITPTSSAASKYFDEPALTLGWTATPELKAADKVPADYFDQYILSDGTGAPNSTMKLSIDPDGLLAANTKYTNYNFTSGTGSYKILGITEANRNLVLKPYPNKKTYDGTGSGRLYDPTADPIENGVRDPLFPYDQVMPHDSITALENMGLELRVSTAVTKTNEALVPFVDVGFGVHMVEIWEIFHSGQRIAAGDWKGTVVGQKNLFNVDPKINTNVVEIEPATITYEVGYDVANSLYTKPAATADPTFVGRWKDNKEPLARDGISIGEITREAGESVDFYDVGTNDKNEPIYINWSRNEKQNYIVKFEGAKLEITKNTNPDYALTVYPVGDSKVYDGTALTLAADSFNYTAGPALEALTPVVDATITAGINPDLTLTDVDSKALQVKPDSVKVTIGSTVYTSDDLDITIVNKVDGNPANADAAIAVTKRAVRVVADPASKKFLDQDSTSTPYPFTGHFEVGDDDGLVFTRNLGTILADAAITELGSSITVTRPGAGTDEDPGLYPTALVPTAADINEKNFSYDYIPGPFTILGNEDIAVNVIAAADSLAYTGQPQNIRANPDVKADVVINAGAGINTGLLDVKVSYTNDTPISRIDAGTTENLVTSVVVTYNGQVIANYSSDDSLPPVDGGNKVTINITDGWLTITPLTLKVKALDADKVYGDADPASYPWTVSDESKLFGGATPADLFEVKLERKSGEDVGSYAITGTATSKNINYLLDDVQPVVPANFKINQRPITLKARNFPNNAYTASVHPMPANFYEGDTGTAFNDRVDETGLTPAFNPANPMDIGTYTIVLNTPENLAAVKITGDGGKDVKGNYLITLQNGNYDIVWSTTEPLSWTLETNDQNTVYNGITQTADTSRYTVTFTQGGKVVENLYIPAGAIQAVASGLNASTTPIEAIIGANLQILDSTGKNLLADPKYAALATPASIKKGNYTINPAELTLTPVVSPKSIVQGGNVSAVVTYQVTGQAINTLPGQDSMKALVDTAGNGAGIIRTKAEYHKNGALYVKGVKRNTVGTHTVYLMGTEADYTADNYKVKLATSTHTVRDPGTTPATDPTPTPTPPGDDPIIPVPVGPVAPEPPEAPDPEDPIIVPDPTNPATPFENNPAPAEILDDDVVPEAPANAAWALLNLIVAVLALVFTILLIVTAFKRNKAKEETEEERNARIAAEMAAGKDPEDIERNKKSGLLWRIISIIAGIVAPIVFLLTENIKNPMIFTDRWTLLMVIILVVQVISMLLMKRARNQEEDSEAEAEA